MKWVQITFVGLAVLLSSFAVGQKHRPNIILVMADDLGWGDTGFNGNTIIKTPHLDQMAAEGIKFNRFYSASAVCSPTRASVLTGRNPYRTGVFSANTGILRTEEVTVPELLKEEGYTTGHFGKWHLGTLTYKESDSRRGRKENIKEYNPPAWHGYDEAFVTEAKVPTYDPMKKPIDKFDERGWDYLTEDELYEHYGTYYWNLEGEKVTENLDGDDSRIIMDRVIPFIESAQNDNKPFLAVIWFHTPHMPCVAGPEHQSMYSKYDWVTRNYAGSITAMDDQIGRLRKYLKATGTDSNTMIWFCSDNGPENRTPGSTAIFFGSKRSLHEGGIRVPGLVVWPNGIREGFETDFPCSTVDYLPTIVDLLDLDLERTPHTIDGESLVPLFTGETRYRKTPIRFLFKNQFSSSGNRYKIYALNGEVEFYDLIEDPSERYMIKINRSNQYNDLNDDLEEFIRSCKKSFQGEEYGTRSFDLMKQKWLDPWTTKQN